MFWLNSFYPGGRVYYIVIYKQPKCNHRHILVTSKLVPYIKDISEIKRELHPGNLKLFYYFYLLTHYDTATA